MEVVQPSIQRFSFVLVIFFSWNVNLSVCINIKSCKGLNASHVPCNMFLLLIYMGRGVCVKCRKGLSNYIFLFFCPCLTKEKSKRTAFILTFSHLSVTSIPGLQFKVMFGTQHLSHAFLLCLRPQFDQIQKPVFCFCCCGSLSFYSVHRYSDDHRAFF